MSDVLLPNRDRNEAGAELDAGAVLEAVELLELRWPVEVKWGTRRIYHGVHKPVRSRRADAKYREAHVIGLSHDNGAEQTSRTLWHELAHAAQAERFESMDAFKAASRLARLTHGYERSPFEVEARAAEDFHNEIPLTKGARR